MPRLSALPHSEIVRLERMRAHGACDYPTRGLARRVELAQGVLHGNRLAGWMGPLPEGLEPAELAICDRAHPSLRQQAHDRGYRLLEREQVLASRPSAIPGVVGIELRRLGPGDETLWGRTFAEAVAEPGWAEPALHEAVLTEPGVEIWLASVDGEPAGGGGIWTVEGVTTLFAAGTRPGFRGRGVHQALLSVRVARAAQSDWLVMAVEPGSASQRSLERHGFERLHAAEILVLVSEPGAHPHEQAPAHR
jgi:GNAT superfamily N-acetyltransferase